MAKILSPSEFIKLVTAGGNAEGEKSKEAPHGLEGLVQVADDSQSTLLFSAGHEGLIWDTLPVTAIESVEQLWTEAWEGREVPYVRLRLTKDEESRLRQGAKHAHGTQHSHLSPDKETQLRRQHSPFRAASLMIASIYYRVPDRAFERAARWDRTGTSTFIYEFLGVSTKQDFLNAWQGVLDQARYNRVPVWSVEIYTHASKDDGEDGLEFADGPGGSTLTRADIGNLPVLPWEQDGYSAIRLWGCNTGLVGARGWCPAQAFAQRQGVRAVGETGYAYFSTDDMVYREIGPGDSQVYLQAYRRRRNGPLGDGRVMRPASFNP